jgi:phage baseplate assembly protein W
LLLELTRETATAAAIAEADARAANTYEGRMGIDRVPVRAKSGETEIRSAKRRKKKKWLEAEKSKLVHFLWGWGCSPALPRA